MKSEELFVPEFLLAEIPIKDKSVNDDRLFVYASKWLSLIEAHCEMDAIVVYPIEMTQKRYNYINSDGITEPWVLVFLQNNVNVIDESKDPFSVMDDAFHFLETYMTWEDINIDFGE